MTREERQQNRTHDFIFLIGAFLLLMLAPGMFVLAVIKRATHSALDCGQMWSFAAIVSVAIWLLVWLATKSIWQSLPRYIALSSLTILGMFVGHFGFKSELPEAFLVYYFPSELKTPASLGEMSSTTNAAQLQAVQGIVERYMHSRASIPSALQFLEWSDLSHDGQTWAVTLRYRLQQASAPAQATVRFHVRNGAVTDTQLISKQ